MNLGFIRPLMISWMAQSYRDYGLWLRPLAMNDRDSFSQWLNHTRSNHSSNVNWLDTRTES